MTLYPVNEIYQTIQGEGVKAGTPSVFVRFQGCGVGCGWCDTKQTWKLTHINKTETLADAMRKPNLWTEISADAIAAAVASAAEGPSKWVVLTGGEPSNYDLGPVISALSNKGFRVQLETSGTASGHIGTLAEWVTVSPKIAMPGGLSLLDDVVFAADEIKLAIGEEADVDRFDAMLRRVQAINARITVLPIEGYSEATKLCWRLAVDRGWNLSPRLHRQEGRAVAEAREAGK